MINSINGLIMTKLTLKYNIFDHIYPLPVIKFKHHEYKN